MAIKEENLIPVEGIIKAGQRLVKIGETFVPVGFGGAFEPGAVIYKEEGRDTYYKCASVGETTWDGYALVLGDDGCYTISETLTTGLSYGRGYTPKVDGVYNANATISVGKYSKKSPVTETKTVASITYDSYSCPIDPTGYTQGNYTITYSSELGDNVRTAYNAFYDHGDLDAYTRGWHSASGTSDQWLQWQSTEKVLINGYSLSFADRTECLINSWRLEGSDDGNTWSVIDTVSGYTPSGSTVLNRIVNNETAYFYHRIYVESVNSGDYVTIGLVRAGEVEEYAD